MTQALEKSTKGQNFSAVERWSAADVKDQVQLIQQIMADNMRENEHFGQIPGCGNKKVLLKPGAEKLGLTFRLASTYEGEREPIDLGKGHREYIIKCTLTHIPTNQVWGQGVGSCSTMESKFRYRNDTVLTGELIPQDYKQNKAKYKSQGFICKKDDNTGQWGWYKFTKIENPNPADEYNTVLKMAKKRAQVDAMLTATAASDIFTQDLDDNNNSNHVVEAEYEILDSTPQNGTQQPTPKQSPTAGTQTGKKPANGILLTKKLESFTRVVHGKVDSGDLSQEKAKSILDRAEKCKNIDELQVIWDGLIYKTPELFESPKKYQE